MINQIRTLQYNGPAPPTDDGITSLQRQIKHSIVQVKAEQKELHTDIDVLKGKCCAVQHNLDELIESHVSENTCGKLSHVCPHCEAQFWALESTQTGEFTKCCKNGAIKLLLWPLLHLLPRNC